MLIHSVYFWFKPEVDRERVAAFEAGLADLVRIPDIQSAHFGRPEVTPKRAVIDDSYDWALIEIFPDLEAHDRYQAHPIHAEFLGRFGPLWDKVQVYDVRI